MQQDEAPWGAPQRRTTAVHVDAPVRVPSGGAAHSEAGMPPAAESPRGGALPRSRTRSLTPRSHVRVPGATAGRLERLAFGAGDLPPLAAAVSVLPGEALPPGAFRLVGGADLDALLGDDESGCAPGRHRRPRPVWSLVRHLPGFRSTTPPDPALATAPDADAGFADERHDGGSDAGEDEEELDADFDDELDLDDLGPDPVDRAADSNPAGPHPAAAGTAASDADPRVPAQRPQPEEPAHLRRRRRSPAPAVRAALQVAARRIEEAADAPTIARIACEEAARLVRADVVALVLRAVEGPRVLGLHPGGPDGDGLWGPATLAALLRVGHPVRRVVEGDPLADGGATALLAVPVPSGGSIAGALLARRHDARIFTANEQDVLSRLARMAGAALRAVGRPAPRGGQSDDPVTGLPLGRRFTADVEAAVRTCQRQDIPVSVVALHIDGLARIRTDLGEPSADEVLGSLATMLRRLLRVGDLAYRIGPDELALLLPATDLAGLPSIRQRLEAVAGEVFDELSFPGERRPLALRTAAVPTHGLVPGRSVVDAAVTALQLGPQKVRWSPSL